MGTTTDETRGVESYYVDLYDYNKDNYFLFLDPVDRSHASILEVDPARELIQNIIQNKHDPLQGLSYIETDSSELKSKHDDKYIRLAMHSPVDVHIYDSEGNHVGISASSTDEFTFFDEQIPNAYYLEFGEGKYLGVPVSTTTGYTIELKGTGSGVFTFEMKELLGDVVQKTQTFTDIPVSTTTKATFTLQHLDEVTELLLDHDGDGHTDTIVFTEEHKEAVTFEILTNALQEISTEKKHALLNKAKNAEKQIQKGHYTTAKNLLENIKKDLSNLIKSNKKHAYISNEEVLRIHAIIETLIETKIP